MGLLPVYKYSDAYCLSQGWTEIKNGVEVAKVVKTNDFTDLTKAGLIKDVDYTIEISREAANQKWLILMIVMIAALVVGCILEYFFTRERITEEAIKNAESVGDAEKHSPKKVKMSQQIKICMKDKYWWMIMIFWFLYQFGGMMKNNDMSFYSQAYTNGVSMSSFINTIGAIPTALGMFIAG